MQRRWIRISLVVLLLSLPFVVGYGYQWMAAPPKTIRIATGPEGGRYRQLCMALGTVLADEKHNFTVEYTHTRGSLENLERLAAGEVDFALYQPGTLDVLASDDPLSTEKVRFASNAYSETMHIIVPRNSPIKTAEQLAGKRVGVGQRQSGDFASSLLLLKHLGLDGKDAVTSLNFSYTEIDTGFKQRKLDAAIITTGIDAQIIRNLLKTGRCRLLEVPNAQSMAEHNISLAVTEIPAGLYRTHTVIEPPQPVTTVALQAQLLTHKDSKASLVETVVRTLHDEKFLRQNELTEIFRNGNDFARRKPEFPIHKGATAVYDPKLRPILNSDFVEAMEGMRSFFVSTLIAGFLLFRWMHKRRIRREEHKLDRYIRSVLEIERGQLMIDDCPIENKSRNAIDDMKQLQQFLDDVTRLRQEALSEFTAHQLNEDRATDCFLEMCHALSDKINAKLTRLRMDQCFANLIAAPRRNPTP